MISKGDYSVNILEITTFLRGGAGVFVTKISKALKEAGNKVTVVSTGKYGDFCDWTELVNELKNSHIDYCNINFFSRESSVFWTEVGKLSQLLKKENFDVIHVHSGNPALGIYMAKKIIKKNIPVVATFHSWGNNRPEWMNRSDTLAFNQCNEVYFVSKEYEKYAVNQGVETSKGVIDLGLLLDWKSYVLKKDELRKELIKKYSLDKDDIVISQLGEITERKGQIDLIRAFGKLYNNSEEKNIKLIIIGECKNEKYKKELDNVIDKFNLGKSVIFTGWVKDPYELLAASDIFSFPTYSEGFGLVIIEAIALGIPTIFSSVEGTKDIDNTLRDIKSFGTFLPGDVNTIEKLLKNIICMNREERKIISQNMSKEITFKYDFSKTIQNYKDVLSNYKGENVNDL